MPELAKLIEARVARAAGADRARRIALVGLRGAGKSTLGRMLAQHLGWPFIELDRVVEEDYGASIPDLIEMAGTATFRRHERSALERVVAAHEAAVITTAGGIVSDHETYALLLRRSHTIWIKARPEDHMSRVMAQGDFRPMAANRAAMARSPRHPRSAPRRLCPRRSRGRHLRRCAGAKFCRAGAGCDDDARAASASVMTLADQTLADSGFLDLPPLRLEYRMIGPRPDAAPTVVMLHEGLGSAAAWGSFPDQIAAATGAGVFVYSRAGYGQSTPGAMPRATSFMEEEAIEVLPRMLAAIGFRRGLLLGHSDGASIATIYAGSVQDHRVRGLVLIAPHFFTEEIGIAEIRRARKSFESGALRERLKPGTPTSIAPSAPGTSRGCSRTMRKWDITEALGYIRVPILIVQGEDDQFGTLKQIETAQRECYCPVENFGAARRAPRAAARSSGAHAQSRDRLHQSAVARPPRRERSRPIPGLPSHEL